MLIILNALYYADYGSSVSRIKEDLGIDVEIKYKFQKDDPMIQFDPEPPLDVQQWIAKIIDKESIMV